MRSSARSTTIRRRFMAVVAAAVLAAALLPTARAEAVGPQVGAKSWALLEADTGRLLLSGNGNAQLPNASTTKILTGIIAVERCDLDEVVTVPAEAVGLEGTSMYLRAGETITIRQLVYGLMLSSGNDAAAALAIHIGGSIEGFAEIMNAKAREIGAENSNFVTPNGLPNDNHYTTAIDLGRIGAYAMRNPVFKEIVGTPKLNLPADEDSPARYLRSRNRILWEFDGGNGVKTGYTKKAGKCLVAGAERNGMQLVAVVLNDYGMFDDCKKLLEYGFSKYQRRLVAQKGDSFGTLNVEGGIESQVEIALDADIYLPLSEEEVTMVERKVNIVEGLEAPVASGQEAGTVEWWLNGEQMASASIRTASTVAENTYAYNLGRVIGRWIDALGWRGFAYS